MGGSCLEGELSLCFKCCFVFFEKKIEFWMYGAGVMAGRQTGEVVFDALKVQPLSITTTSSSFLSIVFLSTLDAFFCHPSHTYTFSLALSLLLPRCSCGGRGFALL